MRDIDNDELEENRIHRFNQRLQHNLTAMNRHYQDAPEGFCVTCKGFTTNYNSRGECSECGTEVTADISEGEEE